MPWRWIASTGCCRLVDSGSIEMDLIVENGMGYRPAEHDEEMAIGVIPVDAIFSPVRRVNYQVEKTRVG